MGKFQYFGFDIGEFSTLHLLLSLYFSSFLIMMMSDHDDEWSVHKKTNNIRILTHIIPNILFLTMWDTVLILLNYKSHKINEFIDSKKIF